MFKNVFKIVGSLLGFMQEGFPAQYTQAEKHKQLAGWMRAGCEKTTEYRLGYLSQSHACAIGAAWIGKGRTEQQWRSKYGDGISTAAAEFGISMEVAYRISNEHVHGKYTRLEIADRLERGKYLRYE